MLIIRQYQKQDNNTVKALHFAALEQIGATRNPSYDNDLDVIEERYLNDNGDFLVGVEGDEIVAVGAIRRVTPTKGEIKRIRVRRDVQRRGYGQAILCVLIERARQLKYDELLLDTLATNTPAQRLFEKHGFIETRREKFGPYNLVFYSKWL